jgi:hypothetical protein
MFFLFAWELNFVLLKGLLLVDYFSKGMKWKLFMFVGEEGI